MKLSNKPKVNEIKQAFIFIILGLIVLIVLTESRNFFETPIGLLECKERGAIFIGLYDDSSQCPEHTEYFGKAIIKYSDSNTKGLCCDYIKEIKDRVSLCSNTSSKFHYKSGGCIGDIAADYKDVSICYTYISPSGGSYASGLGFPIGDCMLKVFLEIGDIKNCGNLRVGQSICEELILNKTNE